MKRYIKSSNFGGYHYRYSIISYTPQGKQYTLGGSNDEDSAIDIAKEQAGEIADNPWEDAEDKIARLQMLSVIDDDNEVAVKDKNLEDYIWSLIEQLDEE